MQIVGRLSGSVWYPAFSRFTDPKVWPSTWLHHVPLVISVQPYLLFSWHTASERHLTINMESH